jgi:hypothetical protein
MWFTAGNHEDFDALEALIHGAGCTRDDFPVDYYGRVRCVRDGHVVELPGGLRVGALWGVDGEAPSARRRLPPRAYVNRRAVTNLYGQPFDVLLTHDSPRDAMFADAGSEAISALLRHARPAFAFFGHYHAAMRAGPDDYAPTALHHLHGLEMRARRGGHAEEGSVGVLRWGGTAGEFEPVSAAWLRGFTRHNWEHR